MVTFKKVTIGQGDDQTTSCLPDYTCFKEKVNAIDLNEQQVLDADRKAI